MSVKGRGLCDEETGPFSEPPETQLGLQEELVSRIRKARGNPECLFVYLCHSAWIEDGSCNLSLQPISSHVDNLSFHLNSKFHDSGIA